MNAPRRKPCVPRECWVIAGYAANVPPARQRPANSLIWLMPPARVELARRCRQQILSLPRLPIPPQGLPEESARIILTERLWSIGFRCNISPALTCKDYAAVQPERLRVRQHTAPALLTLLLGGFAALRYISQRCAI